METKSPAAVALFGGALFAAGVAHAQELEFASNGGGYFASTYTTAIGYDGLTNYVYEQNISYSPSEIAAPVFAADGGWTGGASITATQMTAVAYAGSTALGDYANARGIAYAYVQQSADTQVRFDWDFSNEIPGEDPYFSFIQVFDFTNGVLAFSVDVTGDPASAFAGSAVITLEAGVGYGITLSSDIFEDAALGTAANGVATASLTVIPAPGAAGLLGVAGLVAARRRR